RRPWEGGGPLRADEDPWQTVSASAVPFAEGWHTAGAGRGGDRCAGGPLRRLGGAGAPGRLRFHRAAQRARLPAEPVPLAPLEPTHRRVGRVAGEPAPVPAAGHP